MKIKNFLVYLGLLLPATGSAQRPADLANPLVNTVKPRFDFFAAASLPYGMVALGPDTHHGDLWNAGYRYNDPYILNFSHVHNTQTAGIPVMPVVGPCKALQGLQASKCRLSHKGEVAKPGYHKLLLEDYGITAELTASQRTGFHRYTFPAAKEAHVIMDLTAALGPVKMLWGYARKKSNREIEGYSLMAPTFRRKKNCTVYFVARFSKPFDKLSFWGASATDSTAQELVNGTLTSDRKAGVYASYYNLKKGAQVLLQVGISFVSMENARMNLDKEMPDADFEKAVARAKQAWNDYLGRIEVSGGTRKQQVKFYTDLMHTAIGRRISEDVNGQYIDNTGPVSIVRNVPLTSKGAPAWHFMDADGLWGTQWNLNILWSMVYPDYGNDLAQTFLSYYRNAGVLARESWGGALCYVMVGDQTTPLLAALMQTGQSRFNKEEALAGAYKNAFPGGIRDRAGYEAGNKPGGGGIDWYLQYGYVPYEISSRGDGFHRGGTAMTLEYAYQDWCIAQMARSMGKNEVYGPFMKRAGYWRNVYDPSSGYMRPKDTLGHWLKPFDPVATANSGGFATPGFIESNAAIYSYYVPQDIKALIQARGGAASFIENLEARFKSATGTGFAAEHGAHGWAWVDYDNQPGCHMAHLFSHAGAPWKTQYWVRQVKELTFGDTTVSAGYRGDEDQGQMGALSALMALGLFDVQGLADVGPSLEITSPVFSKIVFHLPNNKTFQIRTRVPAAGVDDTYIQSVLLNGKLWNRFEFPFSRFANGGTMNIALGPEPNKAWGTRK
ncbi:GH92 family glycosyl hydrolase [Niabella drilacis]|uniref:Alpha-1,2-mannosidase, putative n=1 Tax=Niabella drilacis (strain DSM 25811 / CCM 8410 / CCUG 62505 / LMG 26954 / E90) TaxID=1285928 RepID=A0A1G6X488_NIADE|nr:GH92 family glycosyl hydrolase [Niabella drilacis]SDD72227.1 alpha-1,2-mannosidase, putative [Niabella drilacis]